MVVLTLIGGNWAEKQKVVSQALEHTNMVARGEVPGHLHSTG